MAFFKDEEIVGYSFTDGEVVCRDCVTNENDLEANQDEILTERDMEKWAEKGQCFCDRCGVRMSSSEF